MQKEKELLENNKVIKLCKEDSETFINSLDKQSNEVSDTFIKAAKLHNQQINNN